MSCLCFWFCAGCSGRNSEWMEEVGCACHGLNGECMHGDAFVMVWVVFGVWVFHLEALRGACFSAFRMRSGLGKRGWGYGMGGREHDSEGGEDWRDLGRWERLRRSGRRAREFGWRGACRMGEVMTSYHMIGAREWDGGVVRQDGIAIFACDDRDAGLCASLRH